MIFVSGSILFSVLAGMVMKKRGVGRPYSTGVLLLLLLSLLANNALAQNYTQSLIPDVNDGMAISNTIAYLLIGEDQWSHERFKSAFDISVWISLALVIMYVCALLMERNEK